MDNFPIRPISDISNMTTILSHLFVFVDTSWPYDWVVDYVAYVLQNVNIHPFASTVTIFTAAEASILVNTTNYIMDVYQHWNQTTHSMYRNGFNLPLILNTVNNYVYDLLSSESAENNLGGRSIVALFVPSPIAYVDERDYNYCRRYLDRMKYNLPNLQFIYYSGGALVRFFDFVHNPSEDLFVLNGAQPAEVSGAPVVQRIRRVPRRLSNPQCYSNGEISENDINSLEQYARLGSINFYRLDSIYTMGRQSMRYLKVSSISDIIFTVCTSRTIPMPFRNNTAPLRDDESCEYTVHGSYSYDLTDACTNFDYEPCPPLFFSVQAQSFGAVSCTKPACQTPDEAQYVISLNNLGCNHSECIQHSAFILTLVITIYFIFK